jgi:hypothetical protein
MTAAWKALIVGLVGYAIVVTLLLLSLINRVWAATVSASGATLAGTEADGTLRSIHIAMGVLGAFAGLLVIASVARARSAPQAEQR